MKEYNDNFRLKGSDRRLAIARLVDYYNYPRDVVNTMSDRQIQECINEWEGDRSNFADFLMFVFLILCFIAPPVGVPLLCLILVYQFRKFLLLVFFILTVIFYCSDKKEPTHKEETSYEEKQMKSSESIDYGQYIIKPFNDEDQ